MDAISLSLDAPLNKVFSELPTSVKEFLRFGFEVIGKLTADSHGLLVQAVIDSAYPNKKSSEEIARQMKIPTRDTAAALAATGVLAALISRREEAPDAILQAMVDFDLISPQERDAVALFVPVLKNASGGIQSSMTSARLANAVLPSLGNFDIVLDLRVGDDKNFGFYIPVAIAVIDTDIDGQRLCLQLTKPDVELLLEKLTSILERIKQAESLAAKLAKTEGA